MELDVRCALEKNQFENHGVKLGKFLRKKIKQIFLITEGLVQDLRQMDRSALSGVLYNTHHVTHRCNRESQEITIFHDPKHKIKIIEYLIFFI